MATGGALHILSRGQEAHGWRLMRIVGRQQWERGRGQGELIAAEVVGPRGALKPQITVTIHHESRRQTVRFFGRMEVAALRDACAALLEGLPPEPEPEPTEGQE